MTNHPNRSGNSAARNPSPAEIRALRERHGLDLKSFAALAYCTATYMAKAEAGEVRLHPATFELLNIKLERRT